ncbi:hypothetical protein [Xylella taiwanensis]|nr:hypothetical protein [Xylella taiwanensis]
MLCVFIDVVGQLYLADIGSGNVVTEDFKPLRTVVAHGLYL